MTNRGLTEREMTFLRLSAAGWNVESIAGVLHLSIPAAKAASRRLRDKLGAVNMVNAVHLAHKRGLLGGAK